MYKGITLNQFIGELQRLAIEHGDDEISSIGSSSGKIAGMSSPFCFNFKGHDATEFVPAFQADVRAEPAQDKGLRGKDKGEVSPKTTALCGPGDLISWDSLMRTIHHYFGSDWNALDDDCQRAYKIVRHYPSAEENDLIVRGELMDSLLAGFGCDLAYYGGQLRFFQEAVAFAPAVIAEQTKEEAAQPLLTEGESAYESDMHKKWMEGALRNVWARVGMSLLVTPEEEKAIFEGDYLEGKEAVMRVIEAGRSSVDGETYIPQECIEDFDEAYGTEYRNRDEECAWTMDGVYVNTSETPADKTVNCLLADAAERSGASQELGAKASENGKETAEPTI